MKLKEKPVKAAVPFEPVLFAALVPSRKPTAKDRADAKERADDAIEPKEYEKMPRIDRAVVVSFSIGPHSIVSN